MILTTDHWKMNALASRLEEDEVPHSETCRAVLSSPQGICASWGL